MFSPINGDNNLQSLGNEHGKEFISSDFFLFTIYQRYSPTKQMCFFPLYKKCTNSNMFKPKGHGTTKVFILYAALP